MITPLCWLGLCAVLLGSNPARAAEPVVTTDAPPLDYFIVVTGGELLEGAYPDAHTHFITRTLRLLGCRCVGSLTVDDQRADMLRALRHATNQAPLVLVTGGLGPTPNDITRETLAEFTGLSLREQPEVLAELERRFGQSRNQLRPNVRRQTLVPEGGDYLRNGNGTAVGLVFNQGWAAGQPGRPLIVALPGPPRELQPMVREQLVPYLQKRCGVRAFGHSRTLRFVGVGQSQIDQAIKDHVSIAPDVIITSLFEGSRVDFTFALPGHTPEDAARLQRLESAIGEHLGQFMYADDGSTLEEVTGTRLTARGARVAIAEVGTGGQLALALRGAKNSSQFLGGTCAAASDDALAALLGVAAERLGGTPEARVQALAEAVSRWAHTPWGLAVGPAEGSTGAGASRVVWVSLRSGEGGGFTKSVTVRETGELNCVALVTSLLDEVRRALPAKE